LREGTKALISTAARFMAKISEAERNESYWSTARQVLPGFAGRLPSVTG